MNNLTEQEALAVSDVINSYLFTAIKQDEIDNIEWLATLIHGYEKLSEYCTYDECYDHSDEPKKDNSEGSWKIDDDSITFTPKFAEPTKDEPTIGAWLKVYRDLTNNYSMLCGKYDASIENNSNGNDSFMYGVNFVMEIIAYKAGVDGKFSDMFYQNTIESLKKAGKI